MRLRVNIAYRLLEKEGKVALVVQTEKQETVLNELAIAAEGAGSVQFDTEISVPYSTSLHVYTPLMAHGAAGTNIVDQRAYKVTQ
jgi:hypothetical protein